MHNAPVPGDEESGPRPGGLTSGAETAPVPKPVGPEDRDGVPGETSGETSGEWGGWFGGASGATGETAVLPAAGGGDTYGVPVGGSGDPLGVRGEPPDGLGDPLGDTLIGPVGGSIGGPAGVPGEPGGPPGHGNPLGVPDGFGGPDDPLGVPGVPGEPLGVPGVPGEPLGVPGGLDDPLGVPGMPGDPLGVPSELAGVPGVADIPVPPDELVEPAVPGTPDVLDGAPPEGAAGPGDGPPAPAGPTEPRAARGTTIALVVALVLVVVMSGVLGAVAVMMTRNPDAPPLAQTPVRTLLTPVHFAPVTGVGAAPCSGTDAIPDDKGTSCYQLDPGVTVTTVQKIEEVPDNDGTYSIRLVLSPSSQEQIAALTRETVKQQLAIVVGEKVVAAPRVAQEITQDSLGVAGFDKAQADAIMALLTGSAPAGQQNPGASPAATDAGQPGGTQPGGTQTNGTQPGGTQPGGTQPGGTQPGGTQTGGTQPGGTVYEGGQPGGSQTGGTQQGGTRQGGGTQPGGAGQPGGTQSTPEGFQ
ncbi:hypothetical protein ACGFIJ_05970 [Microbispora bryophytorum]|uniref:SecDF P1 head subdomain-containing protein n=1 Tax=Microbispora bryophytorum TaxID=1460882 RepID=UPI00371FABD5